METHSQRHPQGRVQREDHKVPSALRRGGPVGGCVGEDGYQHTADVRRPRAEHLLAHIQAPHLTRGVQHLATFFCRANQ
eukprot:scaffold435624_cov34-Prasinocladus_malaysianus.AAC.1